MKHILVVSTTGLGDCLWGTPALRALKKSFPEVKIDLVVSPLWKPVFFGNPHIHRIIEYHPQWYRQFILAFRRLGQSYDHTLIFHANKDFRRMLPLLRCSRFWAHQTFSWIPESNRVHFNEPIHGIQRRLSLIQKFGASMDGSEMEIFLNARDNEEANQFLASKGMTAGNFVYVNIGASLPHKRWPTENFITLSQRILDHTPHSVVLGGGPEEKDLIESIKIQLNPGRSTHCYNRPIRANSALIAKARMMVTTDTGPMHIGFALKVPTIAMFGPTHPQDSGPFEIPPDLHRVLLANKAGKADHNNPEEKPNHFKSITVDRVWATMLDVFNQPK